jgi:uncharacterized membrane protein HdeD (DUF308 family)
MSSPGREAGDTSAPSRPPKRRVRGVLVLAMGCLALVAPFFAGPLTLFLVGLLLIACGTLELLSTFHAGDSGTRRSTYLGGMLSVVGGILLLGEPRWVIRGMSVFIAISFLIDGLGKCAAAWEARSSGRGWGWTAASGLIYFGLAFVLIARWSSSGMLVVGWVVGCRMLTSGWAMLLDRDGRPRVARSVASANSHPDSRLHLPPHPEFAALDASMKRTGEERRAIDAYWCWLFVVLFFAIHVGRMNGGWNLVGMISPLVAVLGDIGTAMLLAFGIIFPARMGWRKLTRPLERRVWWRLLARRDRGESPGVLGRLSRR